MDSPQDRDEFSTPPTTPLPPSLSRPKTEHRPSSLRLGSAAPADFLPNIELGSPEVNTPESAGNRGAPTPRVAATTMARGPRTAQLQAHHAAPPKSPYFVHSHFDRGVSLTDWLRTNGPSTNRDGTPNTVDIVNDRGGGAKEGEVFEGDEGDEDDEDYSQTSLTKQLAETAVGVREMSKQLGRARIQTNIRNVLIITKAKDNRLIKLTRDLALYLMLKKRPNQTRGLVVYVDCQLRKSKRFDVEGMAKEYPHLFQALPRRQSSTAMSSNASFENVRQQQQPTGGPSENGQLRYWTNEMCASSPHLFDFVVTLGGDGTVLYTSWLFQRIVPPVLPFALGSLGFLTNFDFADHQAAMDSALEGGIRVNLRMRFTCTVYRAVDVTKGKKGARALKAIKKAETGEIMMQNVQRGGWEALEGSVPENCHSVHDKVIKCFATRPVETFEILNDLVVDRGPSPYMSQLELFADEHHLTTVQADGLCIATPTGSTAYSLSAGGSLAHPEIPSMLITPLCPHTLSFRPMLLPDNVELRICLPFNSRSTGWASFDGRGRVELRQGDHIKVTASKFPFPTVCADRSSTDWFSSISRTLKWNERERQKSFVVVEENPEAARADARRDEQAAADDAAADVGDEEDEDDEDEDEEEGEFDIDFMDDTSSQSSASAPAPEPAAEPSPGMRQARETMLQPEESELGREKTREDARQPPHSARHVAFAGGDRGRPDPQRTPTITQKGMRSRSAEARHYHPRAFAVWGQDDSESENTASDDEK